MDGWNKTKFKEDLVTSLVSSLNLKKKKEYAWIVDIFTSSINHKRIFCYIKHLILKYWYDIA